MGLKERLSPEQSRSVSRQHVELRFLRAEARVEVKALGTNAVVLRSTQTSQEISLGKTDPPASLISGDSLSLIISDGAGTRSLLVSSLSSVCVCVPLRSRVHMLTTLFPQRRCSSLCGHGRALLQLWAFLFDEETQARGTVFVIVIVVVVVVVVVVVDFIVDFFVVDFIVDFFVVE